MAPPPNPPMAEPTRPVRVVIVDDHAMFRRGVLILGAGLFTLVREEKVTPWWRRAKMV